MTKINMKDLFANMQKQMEAQLNTNREFIEHPGSKGDALENVWIEWLKHYLPNRYCVDKAIVIDHTGETSHQIDLVIYDQLYSPFVFSQNGFHYIPAEAVYAVFEVKPDIEGHIQYAGEKIESVRRLLRTSVNMINSGVVTQARPLTKIVGGILASTNSIKKLDTLKSHIEGLKGLQTLELGCAVDSGCFYVNYKGEEDTNEKDFLKRINDYYSNRKYEDLTMSEPSLSLVTFFLQLNTYLQQGIGTVAAIDFGAYGKEIGLTIDHRI